MFTVSFYFSWKHLCRFSNCVPSNSMFLDTDKTFADQLYAALVGAGIHTFRADDELEREEDTFNSKLTLHA